MKTTLFTTEFNGVAERFNRIIFDKVRTTIESEQVPMELWPLVQEDMVRKTNITVTRAVDGLIPLESFLNEVSPDSHTTRTKTKIIQVWSKRKNWNLPMHGRFTNIHLLGALSQKGTSIGPLCTSHIL